MDCRAAVDRWHGQHCALRQSCSFPSRYIAVTGRRRFAEVADWGCSRYRTRCLPAWIRTRRTLVGHRRGRTASSSSRPDSMRLQRPQAPAVHLRHAGRTTSVFSRVVSSVGGHHLAAGAFQIPRWIINPWFSLSSTVCRGTLQHPRGPSMTDGPLPAFRTPKERRSCSAACWGGRGPGSGRQGPTPNACRPVRRDWRGWV